jgi:Dolichyl-phosphate-mannose-protein mannosyltransferase
VTAWLRRHPLAAFLPLQALLYCWNLTLLAPWGDEAGELPMLHGPLGGVLHFAAIDVHPPLYYLLLFCWQKIPLGIDWVAQARLISVLFALLGTVALDGLWGRRFEERTRLTLLALWTLSPCLLLYARMCRSYTLQMLLVIVAAALLSRVAAQPTWRWAAWLALALLAAMYTHYVAGIALIATVNLALFYRRRWPSALAIDGAIAIGYLPWIWRLTASLASWGSNARNYTLSGSRVLEVPVKFAYWSMSFVMGEAVPDAVLVLGALLLPLVVAIAWRGARRTPEVAWLACALGAIGFIGVARWVSYPFVPARMLFVLPFFLLLVARGAADSTGARRRGNLAVAAMLLLSLSGIWCYFHTIGFRNKQYPMPMRAIAGRILGDSPAPESAILVDSTNSDPVALEYALDGQRPCLWTGMAGTPAALTLLLADPRVRTVWFLRNTHDISPAGLNAQFEARLHSGMTETVYPYQPYTPLERLLLGTLRSTHKAPWYFSELLEFRR